MSKERRKHSSKSLEFHGKATQASDGLDTMEMGNYRKLGESAQNIGFVKDDFTTNFSVDSSNVTGNVPSTNEGSDISQEDDKSIHSHVKPSKLSKIVKFVDDNCCLCFLPLQIYNYLSERSPKVMLVLNTLQIVVTNTILSIVDVSTDVKKAYDYLS